MEVNIQEERSLIVPLYPPDLEPVEKQKNRNEQMCLNDFG